MTRKHRLEYTKTEGEPRIVFSLTCNQIQFHGAHFSLPYIRFYFLFYA